MDTARIFKKLAEQPIYMWVALAALMGIGVLLFASGKKVKWSVRMLASTALCIALAYILSLIRLYRMPQGGSITPGSMLPIMAVGFAFGPLPGMLCGLCFGLLQLLQGFTPVHPVSILLDYPLAFMMIGLSGIFRGAGPLAEPLRFPMGVLTAGVARVTMHVLSGVFFFAEYAGDQNPWIYSIVYNMSCIGVDTLICCALSFIPSLRRTLTTLGGTQPLPTARAKAGS